LCGREKNDIGKSENEETLVCADSFDCGKKLGSIYFTLFFCWKCWWFF